MEEIHDFLYPPPPRVPVERYVATRTMTPDVAPRQPSAVSAAPVASTSLVSASQPRQLTYADRPLVGSLTAPSQHVRRREAPWTATSYHNPATAEFAPQRTFCSPASGRGMQTSVKPSIAVTASPASPMNSSRQSHDESFGSVVHHVGSRGASTPVRRWAQRGAAVPEPSPSIRF
jgi:hypothetical protein